MLILVKWFICTALLFCWYLVAMWMQKRMHPIREEGVIIFGTLRLLVAIGALTDVLYNLTFGTIIFLELPRLKQDEWTLSRRLARIRDQGRGWRLKTADFICERFLNPYDPDGHHC